MGLEDVAVGAGGFMRSRNDQCSTQTGQEFLNGQLRRDHCVHLLCESGFEFILIAAHHAHDFDRDFFGPQTPDKSLAFLAGAV